jgi:hypothetical protein
LSIKNVEINGERRCLSAKSNLNLNS